MHMIKKMISKKSELIALVSILLFTTIIYLNHFDNPFFFDDSHTINNNASIKSLDNWTSFFTDAKTFSSLPANRAYRPWVTLMNAIDYKLGGGLNSIAFHIHIFLWFLTLIVLVNFLSKNLYKKAQPKNRWISLGALFSAGWFALHTTNAETINYICARSDSYSTLAIVASLLLYISPIGKKYYLYLITMVIGIWTKQTGVMFFPILFVYIILFEEDDFFKNFKKNIKKNSIATLRKITPAGILATTLFIFNQYYLTPNSTNSTNQSVTRFEYISTQFFVIKHYLSNFILPINLSADPDISIIKPWYSLKILAGLLIVGILIWIMIKTALKKELRPIAFGIAWFFIALIPTTLNPLYQIANDHRMFFPFIGLFVAFPWGIIYLIKKYDLEKNTKNFSFKLIALTSILLIGYSYGTYQRNKVWDNSTILWRDVTIKSPKNGRGLMNYGLALMAKGNYNAALVYFERALKLTPNWGTLYTNIAILNGALGNHSKAGLYFNAGASLDPNSPDSYYYHARYLVEQKKYTPAGKLLRKSLSISPNHYQSQVLLNNIKDKIIAPEQQLNKIILKIKNNPTVKNYLELSIKYYELSEHEKSIEACFKILDLDPNNADAYNNLCVNYNRLKKWKLGVKACQKAIIINPDFQLAKNNLNWANSNLPK